MNTIYQTLNPNNIYPHYVDLQAAKTHYAKLYDGKLVSPPPMQCSRLKSSVCPSNVI